MYTPRGTTATVMRTIASSPPTSLDELLSSIDAKYMTIYMAVRRLRERGLVKVPRPKSAPTVYAPTAAGKELAAAA